MARTFDGISMCRASWPLRTSRTPRPGASEYATRSSRSSLANFTDWMLSRRPENEMRGSDEGTVTLKMRAVLSRQPVARRSLAALKCTDLTIDGCCHVCCSRPVIAFHSLHEKSADPVAAKTAGVFRAHDQTQAVCRHEESSYSGGDNE